MQAVILAGGKGRRLMPITRTIPKSMVCVHGEPFLLYQLRLIKPFGFKDILLLVCYLNDYIEGYFGDGAKFGLNIRYSYEENFLGTAGALKNAQQKLADEFLLLNGDTYLNIDYPELIKHFHIYNKLAVVTVYDNPEKIAIDNIVIDESGFVTGYNKQGSSGMTHLDAGAMVFKKGILDLIPKDKACSLEEGLFIELINMRQLKAFTTNQKFYDIGSPAGLKEIEGILR